MKTVNPKMKLPYLLKADEAILKRRQRLEEEAKKKAVGEEEEEQQSPEAEPDPELAPADAPEVLDPDWKPTVFKCTVLTAEEHAHLTDMRSQGDMMLTVLDFGLAEIEAFEDENRSPLPLERDTDKRQLFGKKPWKRAHLSRIHARDREEVATFIISGCTLKEAQAKNS